MSAWDEGRPIYRRLPQYGWQDNLVADQITAAYDALLMELQQAILNFPRDFIDPETCRADALDWLAQLSGFTGDYWETSWPVAIKRQLIKDAQMIWAYKGTLYLLQYFFELFDLVNVRVVTQGGWQVGISTIGEPLGGGMLVFSVVVGSDTVLGYFRGDPEWRLIDRLIRLYMPCWCAPSTESGSYLHYHRWRVGLSAAGDPI